MQWVVVTQWVRTWWCKSHLTKASPAGQERTPRASPAMGGRSWSERGGRPRDGAPQEGESWSAGEPQRYRGQSRRWASAGRQPSGVRQRRVRRTPPGSESGACRQRGNSGTWESHWSPCGESGGGVPPGEGKTPGAARKLQPRQRALWRTTKGTQSQRREARYRGGSGRPERPRAGLWAVGAEHRTDGREPDAPGWQGGAPRSQGPRAGKETPGLTLSGGPSGSDAGLSNRRHATPAQGDPGQTLSGAGL